MTEQEIKQRDFALMEQQLNLLVEFGKELSNQTKLDDLLALIAAQVTKILGAKRCFIFIKDEKRGAFWAKITHGKDLLKHMEFLLPVKGNSIEALVAKTKQSVCIDDAYLDSRFSKELDLITGFRTTSLLCVPLINKDGNVIGVFHVSNKNDNMPFNRKDEGLLKLLAAFAGGSIEIASLYEEVKLSNMETIYRLAITAEYRDQQDTKIHLYNISRLCQLLALELKFTPQEADIIKNASLLHDIGKVAIPDNILLKPAKLTEEEFEIMKKHTEYGGKILAGAKSKFLETAYKMSKYHHEHYNGKGYPEGLKNGEIPLEARIMSVADVFDALCMKRVYKKAWPLDIAYDYIIAQSGKDFDPQVVKAFIKIYPEVKRLYQSKKK